MWPTAAHLQGLWADGLTFHIETARAHPGRLGGLSVP
jgi:hypothetical protein